MSTYPINVAVDATSPVIIGVTETSSGPYVTGDTLSFTVVYSANVTVVTTDGTPFLQVQFQNETPANGAETIGGYIRNIPYASGSGTENLVFSYTILASDYAEEGNLQLLGAVILNGGTIKDSGGDNAYQTFTAPLTGSDTVNHQPAITSVTDDFISTSDFQTGDAIQLTVNYDVNVTVVGVPQIRATIGSMYRFLTYVSGSGTTAILFSYTVTVRDFCHLNDFILDSFIQDVDNVGNTASITDGNGNNANLSFGNLSSIITKYVQVNPVAANNPYVTSLAETSTPPYVTGGVISLTATFSAPVTVTGTPEISLKLDSGTIQLAYASGSTTNALVFSYTVLSTDLSEFGGGAAGTAINLNSGTILGAHGVVASLVLPEFTLPAGSTVNHQPIVVGVALAGGSGTDTKQFKATDTLALTVTFDEAVTVAVSNPTIPVVIGANTRTATYASGSGTINLVFHYTVQSTDYCVASATVGTGLSVTSPIVLTGGSTIMDTATGTIDALLTLPTTHVVFATATATPVITLSSVAGITNGHAYLTGNTISLQATFSHPVHVVGSPEIALVLDSGTVQAVYASGSGTNVLNFNYVVQAADAAEGGITVTSPISLNSGHIYDNNGQSVAATPLTFSITTTTVTVNYADKTVGAPTGIVNGHTYHTATSDPITLIMTYDHAVDVNVVGGTPSITVNITTNGPIELAYVAGSGTTALTFQASTATGELCTSGDFAVVSPIVLNGGTIKDHVSGVNAQLTFTLPTTSTVAITA